MGSTPLLLPRHETRLSKLAILPQEATSKPRLRNLHRVQLLSSRSRSRSGSDTKRRPEGERGDAGVRGHRVSCVPRRSVRGVREGT